MSVEVGTSCPACGCQSKNPRLARVLLYEVAPGRHVCGECFDKVRAVDKALGRESGVQRQEESKP